MSEEEEQDRDTPPIQTKKNAENTLGAPRALSPGYVFIYLSGECSSRSGSSGFSAYSSDASAAASAAAPVAQQSAPPAPPPLIIGATVYYII